MTWNTPLCYVREGIWLYINLLQVSMRCIYGLLPEFTMIDSVLFIIFEFCRAVHRVVGVCVCACCGRCPEKGNCILTPSPLKVVFSWTKFGNPSFIL